MNRFLIEIENKSESEIVEIVNKKLTIDFFNQIEDIFDDPNSLETIKNNSDLKDKLSFAVTLAISKFTLKQIYKKPGKRQLIKNTFFEKLNTFYNRYVC